MKEIKLSVAVTIFNEEKSISQMLESLVNQSFKINEIIFCDGGSTDKTLEIIKDFKNKGFPVRVVPRKGKCRGAGRNSAIHSSKNEYVALIDGGSIPDKDWALSLVNCLFKNPKTDVVYGSVIPQLGTIVERCLAALITGKTKYAGTVNPSVSSLLLKKTVWENIGGFPESETGKYIVEDLIFLEKLDEESQHKAEATEAIVLWDLALDITKAYKRFSTYSSSGLAAGFAKTWHYGTFRYLLFNLFLIFLAFFFNIFILLSSILLQLLKVRSYLVNVPWHKNSNRLEKLYDLICSFFIFFIIDIATIHGFLRWVIVDRMTYTRQN